MTAPLQLFYDDNYHIQQICNSLLTVGGSEIKYSSDTPHF